MKALGLSFDRIFSSPWLRARDTAEIVARELKLERRLKFSRHLTAEGDPKLLIAQVARLRGAPRRLLLVGHEPYLSSLAGILLGGQQRVGIALKKGGLCRLDTGKLALGRRAKLKWLLTLRQLTLLG